MTKRTSTSYVATLHVGSVADMQQLESIKKAVSLTNKFNVLKKRVVVKGRKPIVKRLNNRTGNYISYGFGGNIVGGISNAKVYDVYIYDRS